jgi:tyrosinase
VEDSADVFKSELFSKDPEVGFGDGGSVPIQEIPGVLRAFKVDNGAFAEWRVSALMLCYII